VQIRNKPNNPNKPAISALKLPQFILFFILSPQIFLYFLGVSLVSHTFPTYSPFYFPAQFAHLLLRLFPLPTPIPLFISLPIFCSISSLIHHFFPALFPLYFPSSFRSISLRLTLIVLISPKIPNNQKPRITLKIRIALI
jgi:hypothetical protein